MNMMHIYRIKCDAFAMTINATHSIVRLQHFQSGLGTCSDGGVFPNVGRDSHSP